VITSRLATKMIKEDGSPGTFDQGARGIMMPQLGLSSLSLASLECLILDLGTAYLPSGRFYRVCLSLESPTAGSDIFPFTSMFCVSDFSDTPQGLCISYQIHHRGLPLRSWCKKRHIPFLKNKNSILRTTTRTFTFVFVH